MPITFDYDLTQYEFIGSAVRKGRQEGLQEGRQEGIKMVVRLKLKKRFGRLPASVTKRLAEMSDTEAEKLAVAILDAKSRTDLFGTSPKKTTQRLR